MSYESVSTPLTDKTEFPQDAQLLCILQELSFVSEWSANML